MYYLGCSGWYYQDWENSFYKGIAKKEWFSYYAKKFNTVELNNSFYRFPTENAVKKWYKQAPSGFVYSVKANRWITHMKKFKATKRMVNKFYSVVKELGEKLGCVLFQLPPNLHFNSKRLKEILAQMDNSFRNVIEFRHESWWNKEVYDALKEKGIIFCIVSGPGLPADFVKTAKEVYVRLHGRTSWYDYNYSKKELEEYARKTKKVKKAWVYFNNDYNAYAPKNCLELKKIMVNSESL